MLKPDVIPLAQHVAHLLHEPGIGAATVAAAAAGRGSMTVTGLGHRVGAHLYRSAVGPLNRHGSHPALGDGVNAKHPHILVSMLGQTGF